MQAEENEGEERTRLQGGKRKRRQQAVTCAVCGKECRSSQAHAIHFMWRHNKKDDNPQLQPLHGNSKKRPRSEARSTTEPVNGGHQGQPSSPSTPTLHYYPAVTELETATGLIDFSLPTEMMTNVSSAFRAWPSTPGPGNDPLSMGITPSSSSSSSSSRSCPTYMLSPLRSPPMQPAIICTSTGVAEVLCELHHAPEHSTGTQLRLLVSEAHVDALQPSVTVHGFNGGPIWRPWTHLTQCRIKRGRANKAGWVAFFVCDVNWEWLECRNLDQTHRPTRHRLAVSVTNVQGQVIYRHQITQHKKRMVAGAEVRDDDDNDDDDHGNEAAEGEDAVVLCHSCFNKFNARFQCLPLEKEASESNDDRQLAQPAQTGVVDALHGIGPVDDMLCDPEELTVEAGQELQPITWRLVDLCRHTIKDAEGHVIMLENSTLRVSEQSIKLSKGVATFTKLQAIISDEHPVATSLTFHFEGEDGNCSLTKHLPVTITAPLVPSDVHFYIHGEQRLELQAGQSLGVVRLELVDQAGRSFNRERMVSLSFEILGARFRLEGQSNLEVDCSQLKAPTTSGSFPVRICYLGPGNRRCDLEKRFQVIPDTLFSRPAFLLYSPTSQVGARRNPHREKVLR